MTQTIRRDLNITPGGIPPVIHLSQYDKASRTLVFTLADFSGEYAPETGAIATVRGTKPDHTGFEYKATLSGSTVTIPVEDQMTAVGGTTTCEIRITGSDGSILGTANFILEVERTALSSDTVISETELPVVEKAAQNANNIFIWHAQTETYMKNAEASATSAKTSETNASASAKAAKTSETNAAALETASKTSETNASNSAKAASSGATQAASSATAASNSAKAAAASETASKTSETNAAKSASAAAQSEKNASSSASAASSSATQAASSATAASNSAKAAAASQTASKTSETNASKSASAAATSEKNAGSSASTASTKATQAAGSATAASTSATQAASSASAASKSASEAKTVLEEIKGGVGYSVATQTTNGLMSAADKKKLDGLNISAITNAEIDTILNS